MAWRGLVGGGLDECLCVLVVCIAFGLYGQTVSCLALPMAGMHGGAGDWLGQDSQGEGQGRTCLRSVVSIYMVSFASILLPCALHFARTQAGREASHLPPPHPTPTLLLCLRLSNSLSPSVLFMPVLHATTTLLTLSQQAVWERTYACLGCGQVQTLGQAFKTFSCIFSPFSHHTCLPAPPSLCQLSLLLLHLPRQGQ